LAFAHRVHAGAIAALPVVDERLPVRADALLLAEGPKLLDQAAPPVDDRAEDIEHQRFHRHAIPPVSGSGRNFSGPGETRITSCELGYTWSRPRKPRAA